MAYEVIRVTPEVKRTVQMLILHHHIMNDEKLTEGEAIRRIIVGEIQALDEYNEVMKAYKKGMTRNKLRDVADNNKNTIEPENESP